MPPIWRPVFMGARYHSRLVAGHVLIRKLDALHQSSNEEKAARAGGGNVPELEPWISEQANSPASASRNPSQFRGFR